MEEDCGLENLVKVEEPRQRDIATLSNALNDIYQGALSNVQNEALVNNYSHLSSSLERITDRTSGVGCWSWKDRTTHAFRVLEDYITQELELAEETHDYSNLDAAFFETVETLQSQTSDSIIQRLQKGRIAHSLDVEDNFDRIGSLIQRTKAVVAERTEYWEEHSSAAMEVGHWLTEAVNSRSPAEVMGRHLSAVDTENWRGLRQTEVYAEILQTELEKPRWQTLFGGRARSWNPFSRRTNHNAVSKVVSQYRATWQEARDKRTEEPKETSLFGELTNSHYAIPVLGLGAAATALVVTAAFGMGQGPVSTTAKVESEHSSLMTAVEIDTEQEPIGVAVIYEMPDGSVAETVTTPEPRPTGPIEQHYSVTNDGFKVLGEQYGFNDSAIGGYMGCEIESPFLVNGQTTDGPETYHAFVDGELGARFRTAERELGERFGDQLTAVQPRTKDLITHHQVFYGEPRRGSIFITDMFTSPTTSKEGSTTYEIVTVGLGGQMAAQVCDFSPQGKGCPNGPNS